jgi:hypothetical protein
MSGIVILGIDRHQIQEWMWMWMWQTFRIMNAPVYENDENLEGEKVRRG